MNENIHPIFKPILDSIFHGGAVERGAECVQCGVAIPKPANSTEDGGPLCVSCSEKDEDANDEPLRPSSGDPSGSYIEDFDEARERMELEAEARREQKEIRDSKDREHGLLEM